ncbi:MAG: NAD(+) kinase [Gammaproteobacteria bacterium]|nr:NAD(+) kinase [Gammaproteobacteria bacterium]
MKIKTIGIIIKNQDAAVVKTVNTLFDFLSAKNYQLIFEDTAKGIIENVDISLADRDTLGQSSDLAIIVGGDGTFLSAVRALADHKIPVLGINLGRLGFLVDISPVDMLENLEQILNGHYVAESRFLLTAQVMRDGKVLHQADAFNDVVVHIRDVARMIEFETFINGQFVNYQRADGLVVSTPTGSTAYALSSGGPLLHATLDAMVLVPICPHTLTNRPLVVNADSLVEIVIGKDEQTTSQLTLDGQTAYNIRPGDKIQIRRKPSYINLVHPESYDYYHILRKKLRWSEQL